MLPTGGSLHWTATLGISSMIDRMAGAVYLCKLNDGIMCQFSQDIHVDCRPRGRPEPDLDA